ncbi:MAG TPA: SPFH domain-containing protein [Actinomycetota bacterium]|nr:SPFH domain-containing protein [Actinomycetota bacterium]
MKEKLAPGLSGWPMLVVDIAVLLAGSWMIDQAIQNESELMGVAAVLVLSLGILLATGFTIIGPNLSRVVTFFGRYLGTIRRNGFVWTYPLTGKELVSLRIQNFDSDILKVNDASGNPIEIAAVIVWRVVETAKAAFEVEEYASFIKIQTETAVRHMASEYPYDSYVDGQHSLRGNADEVTNSLHRELQTQLDQAGIEILRTQLRRLAYSPEIAADMLRRQQAEAVVAARTRIVEGAVGMVEEALEMLSRKQIVELDEERKATMVSNLMVVLCSEHHAQPVINAGSLF